MATRNVTPLLGNNFSRDVQRFSVVLPAELVPGGGRVVTAAEMIQASVDYVANVAPGDTIISDVAIVVDSAMAGTVTVTNLAGDVSFFAAQDITAEGLFLSATSPTLVTTDDGLLVTFSSDQTDGQIRITGRLEYLSTSDQNFIGG